MDLNLGLTIGGILLSIVTFYIGYRKTIGAQAERAKLVNDSIATQLAKHFSLSGQVITLDEITSIRHGKAISAGVRASNVLRVSELRELVISRIFDNEYLDDVKKRTAIDKAKATFDDAIAATGPSPNTLARKRRRLSEASAILGVVSASSALIPLALTIAFMPSDQKPQLAKQEFILPAALVVITTIVMVLFTEIQRRFSKSSLYDSADEDAELGLIQHLQSKLFDQGSLQPCANADFLFTTRSGKLILIEVKNGKPWKRDRSVAAIVTRLQSTMKETQADHVAIVVPTDVFLKSKPAQLPSGFEFHTAESLRAKAISLNNAR